jgi:hypothetical protein
LTLNLVGGDQRLGLRRNQPLGELVSPLELDVGVLLGTYRKDPIGVEEARIAFAEDL